EFLAHAFRILERDTARELRAREAQRMHDFYEHVGETTVVVTNDPFPRGRVPLRERLGEIALHDVAAVRDHAPCEERDEARKGIPEGERDAREHANPHGTLCAGARGTWAVWPVLTHQEFSLKLVPEGASSFRSTHCG